MPTREPDATKNAGTSGTPPCSPPGRRSAVNGAVPWLLLIALTWQLIAAFRPVPWIIDRLTFDDTYLALQVGANWAEHGFPTFDGLHRTNGFQALWGALVWLLAAITRDGLVLLRAALIVTALFNTGTGVLLWRFARLAFPAPATATWMVALWTAYCLSGRPAMIALDNTLIAPLLVGALLAIHRLRNAPRRWSNWCLVAGLLGLGFWARLDYAVIVAVVWLALGIWACHVRTVGRYVVAAGLLALLAGLLAAFNYWAGGTATPVCGAVKRMIAARIEPVWTVGVLARAGWDTVDLLLKHFAFGVGGVWPPVCSALTRIAIMAVFVGTLAKRYVRPNVWTAVWIAALALHVLALRLWLGAYHREAMWYYGPQHVSACVLLGVCCSALFRRIATPKWQTRWPVLVGLSKLPLALLALPIPPTVETAFLNQHATAQWLRDHVPPNERIAAWNSGHVAYFSDRTVINLDGLVNDARYFELLQSGRAGESYLDQQRVNWVVDRAKGALGPDGTFWGWLPTERWKEVTRIGSDPNEQQLIVRRRAP